MFNRKLSQCLRLAHGLVLLFLVLTGSAGAQTFTEETSVSELKSDNSAPFATSSDSSLGIQGNPLGAVPQPARISGTSISGPSSSVNIGTMMLAPKEYVPNKPNDFQKFVLESTGKLLPLYGADFFRANDRIRPIQGSPVPNDYPIGPGDEMLIRAWGTLDVDFRAVVDRNGLISIPKVGSVSMAGVRAGDATEVVRSAIGKYFRGFNLSVTLGQLRTITIYVVGQAKKPGTYTVSSLSTAVTALNESGGPNENGSLRRVQVRRAGKQIAELDFYSFLAKGERSGDVKLIDGDVLVIPAALGYAALTGKVNASAIYELRSQDEKLQDLLDISGGLPVLADPHRAFVEHVNSDKRFPRSVEEFSLDTTGLQKKIHSGDLITVIPIPAEFSNAVTLRGTVSQSMRVPYKDGMKVTDLIPTKEFLVTKAVVRQQNNRLDDNSIASTVGNLYEEINWDYAVIERLNRSDLTVTLLPFNLDRALTEKSSADNLALQPGDTLTVFSATDVQVPISKRKVFVRIEGEVRKPGIYQVNPGESLIGVIQKAGGVTADAYLYGTEFYREATRRSQQANLEKFITRLEQQMLQGSRQLLANRSNDATSLQSAQAQVAIEGEARSRFLEKLRGLKASGRVSLNTGVDDTNFAQLPDFRLENSDRVVIPNRPDFVQVFGSVNTESAMLWQQGKTVANYLDQSGVSPNADTDAVFVLRANGTVASNSGRWLSSVVGNAVAPGDIIVVPEKVDIESTWNSFVRGTKDITQVFANLGLGAAAVHTLSK